MGTAIRSKRHRRLVATAGFTAGFVVLLAAAGALWPRPAAYVPGEKVEGITEDLSRALPPGYPGTAFEDATRAAGIRFVHFSGSRTSQLPEDMGSGAAWGDYDNDGWTDLFLANEAGPLTLTPAQVAASPARCMLYRNRGDGTFEDATDRAGLGGLRGCFMGAAWGDYDNDGWRDLAVTAFGASRLFRNVGGRFREVTGPAGLADAKGFWTGASWADYDRDGDLDLYICGYVKYHPPTPEERGAMSQQFESSVPFTLNPSSYPAERNLLYRNDGGRFTEVARQAGVQNPEGRSLAAAWCDFDGDGWLDLYVNNDVSMHALYRNRGDGTFQDISASSWACDYRGGMGIAIGDWDCNGDPDMFLTHWIAQENALYQNAWSFDKRNRKGRKGPRELHFMDISDQVGLGQSTLDYIGWGTAFADFDNDRRLDLVMANGSTFEEPKDRTKLVAMRNQIFWNACEKWGYLENGSQDRGFFDVTNVAGDALRQPNVARGLAIADYDRDGAVDMIITRHGSAPLLARNAAGKRGHWVGFVLEGRKSCHDAIGAQIRVSTGPVTQLRLVGAASSYLSQDDLAQHVGLGDSAKADRVEVRWPSGAVQAFAGVEAGRLYRLVEGGGLEPLPPGKAGRP